MLFHFVPFLCFFSYMHYSQRYGASTSSPVARDHWEIFELIIKESGDKGSDGKGRKSEAFSFSFPSLPARALRSFPSSLSRASRVLASSPIPT